MKIRKNINMLIHVFYIASNKKWLSGFSLISRLCFDIFDPSSMWLGNKSIQ